MKTLAELVGSLLHAEVRGPLDRPVTGISYHSARVQSGDLFVCLPGTRSHGKRYIKEALAAGAVAVVTDVHGFTAEQATVITVPNTRLALALLAACYYGYPATELVLTGVTGTNGKTTTTHLIDALLQSDGAATGLLGTVGYHIRGQEFPSLATTPEASDLQALLRQMVKARVTHVTMEVSSHALAWYRTIGCDFDTVVLTNITEDHLDFHQTFDHYLASKSKLFAWLGSLPVKKKRMRRAILNGDDPYWRQLAEQTPGEVLLYGLSAHCHVRASDIQVTRDGVNYHLETPEGQLDLNLKMTGLFSVYNSLASVAVALVEGLGLGHIKAVLEEITGVPGRFEVIDEGQDFTVIVDYAHTPDGLENILRAVREFAQARVLTVFGCGGERDRSKRPLMGEIAGIYSDFCIVTADNPRGEEQTQIFKEILPGLQKENKSDYLVLPDRKEAIESALSMAQTDDVVIIAGKGHETQQIFRNYTIPFDDRLVVKAWLQRRLTNNGDQL
ncbi:MAG TPA: UDP-N-acetylmuramoyl-L-alanyl-D-glutamate--2,6-diaminopimelate ligase [Oscillospiraceae bacterium]|nr:UDP-N-acetylmuramoyl-L-alanyl-D-glutamate--2,6-diaminopimelate ligase [Oscillospiraceae bacterium]